MSAHQPARPPRPAPAQAQGATAPAGLAAPQAQAQAQAQRISAALLDLKGTPDGQPVLDELGMGGGFEAMSEEDAEFMIDLMNTLLD